jgi:hypothetical protein
VGSDVEGALQKDYNGEPMMILVIVLACIVSAILYRAGGMGKEATAEPKWIPIWLRKSWVRDWLLPGVLLSSLFSLLGPFSFLSLGMVLLFYILSGAALSTYWDFLFGYDNYWVHGFFCGLAGVPLIWAGIPWPLIVGRLIICTVGMGLWSKLVGKDYVEEMGRGVFFIL